MKICDLLEARRNPHLNGKTPIIDQINQWDHQLGNTGYATFTRIDKLGINPMSPGTYDTPVGIYAYPLAYLKKQWTEGVPFASTSPYIRIFDGPNANQWNLSKFPAKLKANLVASVKQLGCEPSRVKSADTAEECWLILADMSTDSDISPSMWMRKVLTGAGIRSVLDPGLGIIHPNEPLQAVFFFPSDLVQMDVLRQHIGTNSFIKSSIPELMNKQHWTDDDKVLVDTAISNARKRLPELEKLLMSHVTFLTFKYVRKFFTKEEKIALTHEITTDPPNNNMLLYLVEFGDRVQHWEPIFIKNPMRAAWYARHILKRRWMAAEKIIASNPLAVEIYNQPNIGKPL
jgi:hypothetical protein